MEKENENFVSWKVFTWVASVVTILLGAAFLQISDLNSSLAAEKDARIIGDQAATQASNDIKVQLSQIQTDLQYIKQQLQR